MTLAAGTVAVQLTDIPADVTASFNMFDALGVPVSSDYTSTAGASVVKSGIAIAAAGDYYVKVTPFNNPVIKGSGNLLPVYGSTPYSLKLVQ